MSPTRSRIPIHIPPRKTSRTWGSVLSRRCTSGLLWAPPERVGALAAPGDSARGLLDAALSSPSGRGLVVADGKIVGTVTTRDVLGALERRGPGGSAAESPASSSGGGT